MSPDDTAQRRRWMGVLAKAETEELTAAWETLAPAPVYEFLRRPETGLVMLQARIGGDGGPFNLGEMTVSRCTVRLADGTIGHAYVAGRDPRHAELAAVFDALLQEGKRRHDAEQRAVERLAGLQADRRRTDARKTAATRVEFFTLVRGED
jgi:alpha-D-ribose 1-methylphosphonate 5-triphosphate synthase subunit PhnG